MAFPLLKSWEYKHILSVFVDDLRVPKKFGIFCMPRTAGFRAGRQGPKRNVVQERKRDTEAVQQRTMQATAARFHVVIRCWLREHSA